MLIYYHPTVIVAQETWRWVFLGFCNSPVHTTYRYVYCGNVLQKMMKQIIRIWFTSSLSPDVRAKVDVQPHIAVDLGMTHRTLSPFPAPFQYVRVRAYYRNLEFSRNWERMLCVGNYKTHLYQGLQICGNGCKHYADNRDITERRRCWEETMLRGDDAERRRCWEETLQVVVLPSH